MPDANVQSPEISGQGGTVPNPGPNAGPSPSPDWQGQNWQGRRRHSGLHGVVTGFFIVLVGLLFLLQNLGVLYIGQLWQFWPVILIGVGLSRMVSTNHPSGRLWGAFVAGLGVVFLFSNLGWLPRHAWNYIWPLALILWGITMMINRQLGWDRGYRRRRARSGQPGDPSNFGGTAGASNFGDAAPHGPSQVGGFKTTTSNVANRLNEYAILGGIKRRIDTQDFEGGEATAVLGGVELDLSQAGTKLEEVTIEANAFMGGVEIRVPQNWEVIVQGMGILGGYDDATRPFAGAPEGTKRPRLIITGQAMCGGIQVKN